MCRGPYRKTLGDSLPEAVLVADPFHVVKLANTRLDDVRRRTQQDTLGRRGHRDDPLYRSRKPLTIGHERLDDKANAKLENLLEAGDPHGEVRMAWHASSDQPGTPHRHRRAVPVPVPNGVLLRRLRAWRWAHVRRRCLRRRERSVSAFA
ncbi:transposase [Aquihabitans daechungensis]|uniref:transposase n=1 Tax=Aquihabitans daechungensis TaxID=1052257 RepID=UPI003BA2C27A